MPKPKYIKLPGNMYMLVTSGLDGKFVGFKQITRFLLSYIKNIHRLKHARNYGKYIK